MEGDLFILFRITTSRTIRDYFHPPCCAKDCVCCLPTHGDQSLEVTRPDHQEVNIIDGCLLIAPVRRKLFFCFPLEKIFSFITSDISTNFLS
ncbi:hypothetical protein CEXT_687971 [Caerostris extrusa]|uniref:Uncharacterized protein n=1 Tax=Caerostris extrusa TaxID=172846 RepID=A0AAV4SAT5_CAEEX|nr:hypothetical protein CEXT_687971 [Caerostris extrusa]